MRLTLLVLIIISNVAIAQTVGLDRKYSDTLPERFIIDRDQLREHIFAGVPRQIRTGPNSRKAFDFAHSSAHDISDLISSGEIYSDWNELENYLNEILQRILPEELKNDSVIHIYVAKDGSYNAFMTPSGHSFVHIGLIAEVQNEASIAGVLCHELAHYYLKHSLYTFLEEVAGNFDNGVFNYNKSRSKFSVKNELQADSMAAVWLQKSGYNIEGLISSFKTMNRLEKNRLKRGSEWKLKETTHPLSQRRLDQLTGFYNRNKNNLGKNFLVDEAKFYRLKEEVKPEILKSHLANFDYSNCIEKAFKFHLFDPDNVTYIYYLMEGIRREAYMDVDVWKQMFITNNYFDSVNVNDNRHKEKMTDHLFKKFDLDIISIDPADGMKLKARFYWRDTPKFTTYEEAYNFFYNLSQALNCSECVLSNALSYTSKKDIELRNKFLEKYLRLDNIKHKEYAENTFHGTIYSSLTKNKIVAFNGLKMRVKQGSEIIPLPDKNDLFANVVDSVLKNQNKRVAFYLPEYKKNHLNDYTSLVALENFSMIYTVSKGEKTELHVLDPHYWELFYKFKVDEIEFVFPNYFESRSNESSIEAYQKIINSVYSTIFDKTSTTKYVDILVTSVREIEGAAMKLRLYNGENKLTSKEKTSDQLTKIIKYELYSKEKAAREKDQQFRNSNN